jgi:hypothetical protein
LASALNAAVSWESIAVPVLPARYAAGDRGCALRSAKLDPDLSLRRSELRRLRQRLRAEPAMAERRCSWP